MVLTSDYHTHTRYSHGKGSVLDNAVSAKEKGLLEIAISDHGFSHPVFGLRKNKLRSLRNDIEDAKKITGINVLMGIESNITSSDGGVDLKPKYYDKFDVFLAGFHKFVFIKPSSFFSTFIPDFIANIFRQTSVPSWVKRNNTRTFVNVIKKNPVDVITHLNFGCYADAMDVAKVASDYGTFIELNSKKVHLKDEELNDLVVKTDVNFIIDSDAHSVDRVGEISLVEKMLERVNVPESRIVNINGKLPDFRFRKFKEKL